MDLNKELPNVTFELREHADGRWDLCFCSENTKTFKVSRMTFKNAIKQLHRVKELRDRIIHFKEAQNA